MAGSWRGSRVAMGAEKPAAKLQQEHLSKCWGGDGSNDLLNNVVQRLSDQHSSGPCSTKPNVPLPSSSCSDSPELYGLSLLCISILKSYICKIVPQTCALAFAQIAFASLAPFLSQTPGSLTHDPPHFCGNWAPTTLKHGATNGFLQNL